MNTGESALRLTSSFRLTPSGNASTNPITVLLSLRRQASNMQTAGPGEISYMSGVKGNDPLILSVRGKESQENRMKNGNASPPLQPRRSVRFVLSVSRRAGAGGAVGRSCTLRRPRQALNSASAQPAALAVLCRSVSCQPDLPKCGRKAPKERRYS